MPHPQLLNLLSMALAAASLVGAKPNDFIGRRDPRVFSNPVEPTVIIDSSITHTLPGTFTPITPGAPGGPETSNLLSSSLFPPSSTAASAVTTATTTQTDSEGSITGTNFITISGTATPTPTGTDSSNGGGGGGGGGSSAGTETAATTTSTGVAVPTAIPNHAAAGVVAVVGLALAM